VPDLGPLTEGPGPTSSPGSLPAPRVACRCSPVGFDRQQLLGIGFVGDVGGEGGETVVVVVIVVPIDTVPFPCFDNTPRIMVVIDLLLEVDRGSVVKASLELSLALRPCTMLVVRLASRLLYFLFIVATRGRVALVHPPRVRLISAVSPWCSNLEGRFRVEDTGCCPSSCTSACWVRYCSL
jgi:hypothetical protein